MELDHYRSGRDPMRPASERYMPKLPPGAETIPEVAAQRERLAMALDEADAGGDFDKMLTLVDRNCGPALLVDWMTAGRTSTRPVGSRDGSSAFLANATRPPYSPRWSSPPTSWRAAMAARASRSTWWTRSSCHAGASTAMNGVLLRLVDLHRGRQRRRLGRLADEALGLLRVVVDCCPRQRAWQAAADHRQVHVPPDCSSDVPR